MNSACVFSVAISAARRGLYLMIYHLFVLQTGRPLMKRWASIILCSCFMLQHEADAQTADVRINDLCSNVTMLDAQPLSSLTSGVRQEIRRALKSDILSIINDPGMGLDVKLQDVKLDAIRVTRRGEGDGLYVVHWGYSQFGVNGMVWIVEVKAHRATNLVTPTRLRNAGRAFGGWGMQIISHQRDRYPEIMFPSKGYRQDGGVEAEAECVHKSGTFYETMACPTDCIHNLNAR